jgi:ABC-type multidrug transport system fused ATPase/permease subunit
VALASVFLKDAPILVLDEVTSHLDAATEAEVLDAVDAFAAAWTCSSSRTAPSHCAWRPA